MLPPATITLIKNFSTINYLLKIKEKKLKKKNYSLSSPSLGWIAFLFLIFS